MNLRALLLQCTIHWAAIRCHVCLPSSWPHNPTPAPYQLLPYTRSNLSWVAAAVHYYSGTSLKGLPELLRNLSTKDKEFSGQNQYNFTSQKGKPLYYKQKKFDSKASVIERFAQNHILLIFLAILNFECTMTVLSPCISVTH